MARATEEELNTALEIFNAGLARTEAARQTQRAIEKAEQRKQDAAAVLKKLQNNPKASTEEKAEAETAYRELVEAVNALRAGGPLPVSDDEPETDAASEPEAEAGEPEAEAASEAAAEPAPEPAAELEPAAEPEPAAEAEPPAEAGPEDEAAEA